jgi:hypothetical protein
MLEETWRRMLRLKTIGEVTVTGARRTGNRAVTGILAVGFLMAGVAQAQAQGTVAAPPAQPTVPTTSSKIGPAAPVTYDNKYEIFAALNFQNFQAGQALPKRMNLGGGEFLATYWLPGDHWFTRNIGIGGDYRIDAGTTPVFANGGITKPDAQGNTGINNRPLVYLNTFMGGAQYRSKMKNQYVAVNFHGYGGVSHGTFSYSLKDLVVPLSEAYAATGLYSNRTKPMAALGASIDFNLSKRMAIRFSPDLILEHFGTETREFVAVSGGVIWRFGKQK